MCLPKGDRLTAAGKLIDSSAPTQSRQHQRHLTAPNTPARTATDGQEDEDGAAVAPSEDAGYNLGFQTENKYVRPVWPAEEGKPQMSMHLEIEVDLEDAEAYAVSVGAEEASYQPQKTVRVMLDPAGHPFCLYLDPRAPASG